MKHVRTELGTCSATGKPFSSTNECAWGAPNGGSTSPLIRQGVASSFMLWSNLLERGLPLHLNVPRSPALDWWTALCTLPSESLLSFCLPPYALSQSRSPYLFYGLTVHGPNIILMPFWIYYGGDVQYVPMSDVVAALGCCRLTTSVEAN